MKILYALAFSLLLSFTSYAQIKPLIYFGKTGNILQSDSGAVRSVKISKDNSGYYQTTLIKEKNKWEPESTETIIILDSNKFRVHSDKAIKEDEFIRHYTDNGVGNYYVKDYYLTGKIKEEGYCTSIFPLVKKGVWKRYAYDGYLISKDVYDNNVLTHNARYLKDGEVDIENVYYLADEMPKYRGASYDDFRKMFAQRLMYPERAAENYIFGRVILEFVIMEDGTISHIQITKSEHELLNKEALRALALFKKWTPGKVNGEPVKVLLTVPAFFMLR